MPLLLVASLANYQLFTDNAESSAKYITIARRFDWSNFITAAFKHTNKNVSKSSRMLLFDSRNYTEIGYLYFYTVADNYLHIKL